MRQPRRAARIVLLLALAACSSTPPGSNEAPHTPPPRCDQVVATPGSGHVAWTVSTPSDRQEMQADPVGVGDGILVGLSGCVGFVEAAGRLRWAVPGILSDATRVGDTVVIAVAGGLNGVMGVNATTGRVDWSENLRGIWDDVVAQGRTVMLVGSGFDGSVVTLDAAAIEPQVTWGTSPGMVTGVGGRVPDPCEMPDEKTRRATEQALEYMGLKPGTPITEIRIDRVFLGSCTNSRIEDLRLAARYLKGRKVAKGVHAMVVPGSGLVKRQAEAEGLDRVFKDAGFEWREAGCSMCLAMNADVLQPGERCASTSNRNFEGRQGKGGRTHLVSPAMAVAAAVEGRFVDIRTWA